MKKFYAVSVIALSMSLGFTSCSDDDDSSSEEEEEEETACFTCAANNITDFTEGLGDLDLGGFGDLFEGLDGAEIEGVDEEQTVCEGENGNAFIGDEDQEVTLSEFIENFELFGTCEEI